MPYVDGDGDDYEVLSLRDVDLGALELCAHAGAASGDDDLVTDYDYEVVSVRDVAFG